MPASLAVGRGWSRRYSSAPDFPSFLALVAQHDGLLLPQVAHPLPNLRAGETLLHFISKRHPWLVAHADDARRLLLALADLEPISSVDLRRPALQPVVEPLHRHFAIAHK